MQNSSVRSTNEFVFLFYNSSSQFPGGSAVAADGNAGIVDASSEEVPPYCSCESGGGGAPVPHSSSNTYGDMAASLATCRRLPSSGVHSVADIPFVRPLDDVRYGTVQQVSPLIRRVIANNPSKYSYRGTGTYIVGHGDVAVIDPGPSLDDHRDALAADH